MKKISEKTKTVITKTTKYETDSGLVIIETAVNKRKKTFTIEKQGDLHPVPLDLPEDFFQKDYNDFWDVRKREAKIEKIEDFEKYPIYFLNFGAEELFDENMNIVAKPYRFSYIGSLKEKIPNDPIYAKIMEKLKEHPFVLELEEEMIPGYNQNFWGQKGIKNAKVFLSQEKYEEIYKTAKEQDKEFWSSRMRDAMRMNYEGSVDFNVYGDEISALLKEYHSREAYYERDDCSCY